MRQCLGAVLLLGLAVGVACVAYAVAPTAVILGSWTGAGLWLWWGVSRKIENPAPPASAPTEEPLKGPIRKVGVGDILVTYQDDSQRYYVDRDRTVPSGGE